MLNFFLSDWRFVSFFLIRASCGLSLVALKRTGCGVATGMSQQVFRVTTFCISTCFQSFSTLVSHVVHHAVLKVNPCRKKSPPQASNMSVSIHVPLKNDFFWMSQGKAATSDRWGGQICKVFSQICSRFNMPKLLKSVNFSHTCSKNKNVDVFGTVYMCIVDIRKAFDSICGWLWSTWDILNTWLTCWPNYTGNSSLRSK